MSWRLTRTCYHFSTQNFNKDVDYYDLLGVKSSATKSEIKLKFYGLAKKYHPDSTQSNPRDEEKFKQITAAYEILSNSTLKKQYDMARAPNNEGSQGNPNYEGFNHSYHAKEQRTYTYRANGHAGAQT